MPVSQALPPQKFTTVAFALARFYKENSGCKGGSRYPSWDTGTLPAVRPSRGPGGGRGAHSGPPCGPLSINGHFLSLIGMNEEAGMQPTLPRRAALGSRPGYSHSATLNRGLLPARAQ